MWPPRSVAESVDASPVLRRWRVEDGPTLVAAWHDDEVIAGSLPPQDRSLDAAVRWIEGCDERERRLLAVDRVIDLAGVCVGEVGASDIDPHRRAALLGWWIGAGHRGRGHATAGVRLMCGLLFAKFDLRAIVAEISPDNETSIRVATAAGFTLLRKAAGARPHAYVRHRR